MTRLTTLGAIIGLVAFPLSASAAPTEVIAGDGVAATDTALAAEPVTAVAGGRAVRVTTPPRTTTVRTAPSGARVTVTRSAPPRAAAPRSTTVHVRKAPPPAPRPTRPAQAGVRVNINVRSPARYSPPPPPSAAPPPPQVRPPKAPPPPQSVVRPPQTTNYYGWRGSTVYVYPRVYSSVWGFWWWAPPSYNYHYHDAPQRPQSSTTAEAPKPKPEALHVGDTSFGVWGGVHRGAYLDGSVYSDPGIRFSIRHRTSAHTGIDFSGGYFGTAMYPEDERNSHRIDVPIQLSGTLHLFPDLPVQLFGIAGVTADFRDFQKVGYTEGGKDFYYEEARFKDTRFGPHIGAGAELMLGPDISLHADARWTYYTLSPGQSALQTGSTAFTANAGVSFYF